MGFTDIRFLSAPPKRLYILDFHQLPLEIQSLTTFRKLILKEEAFIQSISVVKVPKRPKYRQSVNGLLKGLSFGLSAH